MKLLLTLTTVMLCSGSLAAAANDFGPMFSGTSTLALSETSSDDSIAMELQNIEPAAGGVTRSYNGFRVDNANTIQIRPDESVNDIGRVRPSNTDIFAP